MQQQQQQVAPPPPPQPPPQQQQQQQHGGGSVVAAVLEKRVKCSKLVPSLAGLLEYVGKSGFKNVKVFLDASITENKGSRVSSPACYQLRVCVFGLLMLHTQSIR
jgi:hypothetical protein